MNESWQPFTNCGELTIEPKARGLIADDGCRSRPGLKALLATFLRIEVVGEASNGREAVDLAGATLVGTPSGQPANCFGNQLLLRLKHTQIAGPSVQPLSQSRLLSQRN